MAVDAAIPLGFNPQPQGPDMGRTLSMAAMLQQVQQNQQAMQGQNALRQIFADPSSVDNETGQPTQDAIRKVMAVDPQTGMKLRNNALAFQEHQLGLQGKRADLQLRLHDLVQTRVREPSAVAYEQAIKDGLTPEAASARAQEIYSAGLGEVKQSGLVSAQEADKLPPNFDYKRVSANSMSYKDWKAQQEKERADTRADAHLDIARNADKRAGSAEARAERTEKGAPIADDGLDEAARQYISHGTMPPGVGRETIGKIVARAGELRKSGAATDTRDLGTPQEVEVDAGDAGTRRVTAVYDKTQGKWYTAEGHKPLENVKRPLTAGERALDDNAAFTPEEATFMARQYLSGDTSALQNLGRGVQGSRNLVAVRKAITAEAEKRGMSPEEIAIKIAEFQGLKAGERTLGTRTANVEMAVAEAQKLADLALQASDAFDRTQFTPLNKALGMVESGAGGEAIKRFTAANTSFINVYARAISPSGVPTVSDKEHAREMLSTAQTKEQYRAVIDQLKKEMTAAREAPGEVRKEFREGYGGEKSDPGGKAPPLIDKPAASAMPDKKDRVPGVTKWKSSGGPELIWTENGWDVITPHGGR